ncbi:BAR and SH3 domain-containing protein [Sporobolomyces koalae]|uniref:BAR and SH3 domain-containing protein n=1 Tax=Sporobolomyces koalae TaxID=500713 RepID=UPI003178D534
MKGFGKALARAPHAFTSKVGLSSKSSDPETDELVRKFTSLEEQTGKLVKDTSNFREAISGMLTSQAGFATAFSTLFSPLNDELPLASRHPEAQGTIDNIAHYHDLMNELRDSVQPELELIDSRVTAPLKEYSDLLKKIRKTITKREHKLTDFDRHNNSYNKLKDKKEKSLSDEKNLFKYEQDLELATQEYEHYNNMLKSEIPRFIALSSTFISPIFQTFYYIEVGILYTLLEKMQAWSRQVYGDMSIEGLETMHYERLGDVGERLEALSVTKRFTSTARFMSQHRASGGSSSPGLGRTASTTSSSSGYTKPASTYGAASSSAAAADLPPPAYSAPPAGGPQPALAGKRPPPPPPNRPKPAAVYVTALYDYVGQAEGDLSFNAGDKIEVVKKTESDQDWWTGRLNGYEGQFPANYTQS